LIPTLVFHVIIVVSLTCAAYLWASMAILIFSFSSVLFILYAVLIIYYRQSWLSIPTFNLQHFNPITSITIVIPARNEEDNIRDCLHSILAQEYPAHLFEVIVVDDHSTDNTAERVKLFTEKNIKLISLKDFTNNDPLNSYKKKAIEIAVQQSTGSLIVTTDADCIVPNKWLLNIASFYEQHNAVFIAGPVAYHHETNFLKVFQSLDFMTMQGITGASVYKRFHSMCNGANLAYEKKAFNEVNGFKDVDNIASGDDMLLMHKIYKRYPDKVFYLKSADAIVQTMPMNTLSSFFNQRIRWASKADKYDDKRIFWVLLMVYLFNVSFIALGIFSIFNCQFLILLVSLLLLKTIVELFFLFPVAEFFNKKKLLWWFPIAQPFHIIYIIVAGWLGKFGSYRWKGREVK